MSTVSNGTSKLFVANSFPVCFVNYVILGGGGGGGGGVSQIHPDPRKRLSNTLTSEVSALLYILLQVLYRLSTQDSSAT